MKFEVGQKELNLFYQLETFLVFRQKKGANVAFNKLAQQLENLSLPFIIDIQSTTLELAIILNEAEDTAQLQQALKSISMENKTMGQSIEADQEVEEMKDVEIEEEEVITWHLPILFNKSKVWKQLKKKTGKNRKKLIKQLLKTEITVDALKKSPLMVSLSGFPKDLRVKSKRNKVPKGSLSLSNKNAGLHSRSAKVKRTIIGNCPLQSFLKKGVLNPGDKIKIDKISQVQWLAMRMDRLSLYEYNY